MRKLALLVPVVGLALAALLPASPAQAQATRTWVSGVGDDANPCSRTAPCKTFAGAISKTAANGEINCIDPGGFGAVTITKSITIDCDGTFGSILAAGTNGININGAGIVVKIRNISIQGAGTGLIGINFINGKSLAVENVIIMNFRSGSALGIRFAPSAVASLLFVSDTYVQNNGIAPGTGGGISIAPAVGGTAGVVLERVRLLFNNGAGIGLVSTSGPISFSMHDSVVAQNTNIGIVVAATSAITALFDRTSITNNGAAGLSVTGANATLRIGDSTITGNTPGVSVASGTLQSFKNNKIAGNTPDGTPITAFPGPGGTPLQ